MCYKCQGIDQTISHYRHLEKLTTDRQTVDSIGILIAKLEADKKAFHPESARTPEPPMHARPGSFRRRKITEPPSPEDE